MKIKKIGFILIVATLMFAIIANIIIHASYDNSLKANDDVANIELPSNIRDGAPATRLHTDSSGKTYNLTYKNSETVLSDPGFDIYCDENKNEFWYDFDGNYLGKIEHQNPVQPDDANNQSNDISINSVTPNTTGNIDEDSALLIAENYARNMFGNEFDKLTGAKNVSKAPSSDIYLIRFDKTYGEDGFIVGAICTVTVDFNGNVLGCAMPRGQVCDDFSDELVKDLTKADVMDFVNKRASEIVEGIISIEDTEITLSKLDNKFVIKISAGITSEKVPNSEFLGKEILQINETLDGTYFAFSEFIYPLEP